MIYMSTRTSIRWEQGEDGIVILCLDDPDHAVNTLDDAFCLSLRTVADRLLAERETVRGVILTSAKSTFFAGGNLHTLQAVTRETQEDFADFLRSAKSALRQIETLGRPVVAAINGMALGGGLEICLATHHRIAVDSPRVQLGLPEVTFGILPGAGGLTRAVRMFGIEKALTSLLLDGRRISAAEALAMGLVDELVDSENELVDAAKCWIFAQDPAEFGGQPWDAKHYAIPGGTPATPSFAPILAGLPATLRKRLRGAKFPAPHHIMAAAVEGAQVDFDTAIKIEERYLLDLVTGSVAKNMIQANFFDRQQVVRKAGTGKLPGDAGKIAVLGASPMGASIAYILAASGAEVVLIGSTPEAAASSKAHAAKIGGRMSADGERVLARITATDDPALASGADMAIETVAEDSTAKVDAIRAVEPYLSSDAIIASNASALPITGLASGLLRPQNLVGLHFFAPVERMELLEIVRGERTGEQAVVRALDLARRLRKVPIVVNDGPGFFVNRLFMRFIEEGVAMLGEGIAPATIEQACNQAGYPSPVLRLADQLGLDVLNGLLAIIGDDNGSAESSMGKHILEKMVEDFGRLGRQTGKGFYDYTDGRPSTLWPELRGTFAGGDGVESASFEDLQERLLFVQAIEAVKCFDEGIVSAVADANVGAILGIGYPAWTGGPLQYINSYEGGVAGFVSRCASLSAAYGGRFQPPHSLVERVRQGVRFIDVEPRARQAAV